MGFALISRSGDTGLTWTWFGAALRVGGKNRDQFGAPASAVVGPSPTTADVEEGIYLAHLLRSIPFTVVDLRWRSDPDQGSLHCAVLVRTRTERIHHSAVKVLQRALLGAPSHLAAEPIADDDELRAWLNPTPRQVAVLQRALDSKAPSPDEWWLSMPHLQAQPDARVLLVDALRRAASPIMTSIAFRWVATHPQLRSWLEAGSHQFAHLSRTKAQFGGSVVHRPVDPFTAQATHDLSCHLRTVTRPRYRYRLAVLGEHSDVGRVCTALATAFRRSGGPAAGRPTALAIIPTAPSALLDSVRRVDDFVAGDAMVPEETEVGSTLVTVDEAEALDLALLPRSGTGIDGLPGVGLPHRRHRIFISYRRCDSAKDATACHLTIVERFGRAAVFHDRSGIGAGAVFPEELEAELGRASVILVVIGPTWVDARAEDGRHRLSDPTDWVRKEVAYGLRNPEVVVVPLLIGDTELPSPHQLPPNIVGLSSCQAVHVRYDSWEQDWRPLLDRLAALSGRTAH